MPASKRTVLITGCSEGGLGAALAIAFHKAGLRVYATARDPSKMSQLADLGIETFTLDVLSDSSIAASVAKLSSLDILINNAGAGYSATISDLSIPEAKKLFDLNVWSYLAVTQAFLPLLIKSKGMVVNNTSVASVIALPFSSAYNASKAATAMFSECLRLEMAPFDVTVVDLKTGGVKTNFMTNQRKQSETSIPENSIFQPAKEVVEKALRGETLEEGSGDTMLAEQWAKLVVKDLTKKTPPSVIWRGTGALTGLAGSLLPVGWLDGQIKKMTGLGAVERVVRK